MAPNTLRLLKFLIRFSDSGWHSIGEDSYSAVEELEEMGLVEVSKWPDSTWQAKLIKQ